MAASLAAGTEFCGVSTRAEAAAAIPKMKAELAAQGANPAGMEREFWAAYDAALAQARSLGPAQTQAQCDQLRAMSDPAEIKKWEQAARDMEALAEQMKAQGR